MKKLISLLLAIMMVFSLAVTAFANDSTGTGTITIKGVAVYHDEDADEMKTVANYSVYQILEIASYNEAENTYSYIVTNDLWKTFLTTNSVAKQYYTVAENDYVTWNKNANTEPSVAAALVAPEALAFAAANSISATSSKYAFVGTPSETDETADIIFEDLDLGYYLVDSSMGILCGLTTASPDAEATAKNVPPTIVKKVQEDSLANSGSSSWGKTNTADIGQPVDFDITVEVRSGAQNYVVHDTLADGFTMNFDSIQVSYLTDANSYVPISLTRGTDYIVHGMKDGSCVCGNAACTGTNTCTFEIVFTENTCKALRTNDQLVILYNTVLDADAKLGAEGNINTAYVSFGEGHQTEEDQTTTYAYSFDLVKTDGDGKLLNGAEFQLYAVEANGEPIQLVLTNADEASNEGYIPVYRIYYPAFDTIAPVTKIEVPNGQAKFVGIDRGSYYLAETKAPDGYNLLTSRHRVDITDSNLVADILDGYVTSNNTAVTVQNSAGAKLPETGAFGTTMFIFFGTVVMLATGVLLVTKKRMSMIEE